MDQPALSSLRPRRATRSRITLRASWLARALVLLAASFTLGGCAGIGTHAVVAHTTGAAAPAPRSWESVFAHPTALHVRAYNTGVVFTGPRVLIDAHNPRTPEADKVAQWVPALSYLVQHPAQGSFLMDTGVSVGDADGKCDFGIAPFFWAPCRAAVGQDVVSQLRTDGVDPKSLRFALVSHLHGDHAGGIHSLSEQGPLHLLLSQEEWQAASRRLRLFDGYVSPMLDAPYDVAFVPSERAVTMPVVGKVVDLFADGSVWVIPTPGHTRGELSVLLNAQEGPMLFTFDASHLRSGLDHDVSPGFTVDHDAADDSVGRLDRLRKALPQIRVFYGHEPTQWADKGRAVTLAGT